MELELGLGLGLGLRVTSSAGVTKVFGFDLNRNCDTTHNDHFFTTTEKKKKRGFSEAFGDDDDGDDKSVVGDNNNNNSGGGGALVGWPPVKSTWRNAVAGGDGGKKNNNKYVKVKMEGEAIGRKVDLSLHHSYRTLLLTLNRMFAKNRVVDDGQEEGINVLGKLLLKREEESSSPHSYHRGYEVTYEDGDGDWMLVGDVPWETFVKSVKRLKILSGSE